MLSALAIHLMLHILPLAPSAMILDMLPWRVVLTNWQQTHMQQDCAEVLRHILDRCRFPALTCAWEARVLSEAQHGQRITAQDRGTVVSLTIPDDAMTVQDCIDTWHQQHYVHALTTKPPLLAVMLARYSDPDRGKNCQRIACHPQAGTGTCL